MRTMDRVMEMVAGSGPAYHLRMHEFQEEVRLAGIRQERRLRLNAYIKKYSPCSAALARGDGNLRLSEQRIVTNNTPSLLIDIPTKRRSHGKVRDLTTKATVPATPAQPIPSIAITPPKEDEDAAATSNTPSSGSPQSTSSIDTVIRVESSESSASSSLVGSTCVQGARNATPEAIESQPDVRVREPDRESVSITPGPRRTAAYLASLYDEEGKLVDPAIPGVSPTIDEEGAATRLTWKRLTRPSTMVTSNGCIIQKGFVIPRASESGSTPSPQMHVSRAGSDCVASQQQQPMHTTRKKPRQNSAVSANSSLDLYSSSVDKIVYSSPVSKIEADDLLETKCSGEETPINLSLYPPTLIPSNTLALSIRTDQSPSLKHYESHRGFPEHMREVKIVTAEEAESAIESEDEDEIESLPRSKKVSIAAKPRVLQTPNANAQASAVAGPVTQAQAVQMPIALAQITQAPAVPKGILKRPTPPNGFAAPEDERLCVTWVM